MASQLQTPKLEEMMKNLKVDSSSQLASSNVDASKERSMSDATSCISSNGDAAGSVKDADADNESFAADGTMPHSSSVYYGFYYPGYSCPVGVYDDQGYYVGGDGLEIQYPVMQADNGSLVYMMPGIQPGYAPYGSYIPVTTIGVDGQYAGQQALPQSPVFQPPIASPGYVPPSIPYGELVASPCFWDASLIGDGAYGIRYIGDMENTGSKSNLSSLSYSQNHNLKPKFPSDNSSSLESKRPLPSSAMAAGHRQTKPFNKSSTHYLTYQSDVLGKGYSPISKHAYNQGKGRSIYPANPVDTKANPRDWPGGAKLKASSKANGFSGFNSINVQTHGPTSKTTLMSGVNAPNYLDVSEKGVSNIVASPVKRDQYNLPDFQAKYDYAFFFVIKSYSEDDIHKSIKYNVWASTPNGNKRLDCAYQDAQEKAAEKGSKCPVFLFFSVNASGQFCGVAEMIGRVNFDRSMDFWQQDKWTGFFPVKWHIIKDIPNPQLRHIILENNENKPVTNSRDTQEVKILQGIEMLNVFKNYVSKTSILDDFDFYESRQKAMQEKRIWQSAAQDSNKASELTSQLMDVSTAKNSGSPLVVEAVKE